MKTLNFISIFFLMIGPFVATAGITDRDFSPLRERFASSKQEPSPEAMVTWVGKIEDDSNDHNDHHHHLKFVSQDTGKSYNLESEALTKLHHDQEKNFVVEIIAEKTPRFLFWGGKLIVKSFKVLALAEIVPHHKTTEQWNPRRNFVRDRI